MSANACFAAALASLLAAYARRRLELLQRLLAPRRALRWRRALARGCVARQLRLRSRAPTWASDCSPRLAGKRARGWARRRRARWSPWPRSRRRTARASAARRTTRCRWWARQSALRRPRGPSRRRRRRRLLQQAARRARSRSSHKRRSVALASAFQAQRVLMLPYLRSWRRLCASARAMRPSSAACTAISLTLAQRARTPTR